MKILILILLSLSALTAHSGEVCDNLKLGLQAAKSKLRVDNLVANSVYEFNLHDGGTTCHEWVDLRLVSGFTCGAKVWADSMSTGGEFTCAGKEGLAYFYYSMSITTDAKSTRISNFILKNGVHPQHDPE